MTGRTVLYAAVLWQLFCTSVFAAAPLQERFANPPADTRILRIIHHLPATEELRAHLYDRFAAMGFGGMVTNVSFDSYLADEEKWTAFTEGVKEAKARDFSLWLYDECGYPSGAAGGVTLEGHPEYEARGLHIYETAGVEKDPAVPVPAGTPVYVLGMPDETAVVDLASVTDLSGLIAEDQLHWAGAPDRWRILFCMEDELYENTHAAISLAFKLRYVNLLCPEATRRFLEVTHDAYAARLDNRLQDYFVSTFTDEPSLMSLFMKRSDHRVLPWSDTLPQLFESRWGYSLKEALPSLLSDTNGSDGKVRHDFWKTIGDLVSENYFGQIRRWCDDHGILSGGHLLCEEDFLAAIPFYGNFFQCARELTAPSIDCLTSIPDEVPWYSARLLSSVAELDNRQITMSETSDHSQRYRTEEDTRPVYQVSEEEIRGTLNLLLLNGINTITSYYAFKDFSDEALNRLNEWTGRCSTLLRDSRQVTDIALVYPVESAWARFTPARFWTADSPAAAHRVAKCFHDAEENLFRARRDFIHVDNETLEQCRVESGALVYGALRWRVVILPDADTLSRAAWQNLRHFYEDGGVVIALSSRPENSAEHFPDEEVQSLGRAIFGEENRPCVRIHEKGGAGIFLPPGSEALLPEVLDRLIPPEIKLSDDENLRVTHRRLPDCDLFFIINNSSEAWQGEAVLPVAGAVDAWDPATGSRTRFAAGKPVSLALDGYSGVFLLCEQCPLPERSPVKEGVLPDFTCEPLPEVTPVTTAGEDVDVTLQKIMLPEEEIAGWQLEGRLTADRVNTFLFAGFVYEPSVDLTDSVSLCFTAALPEKQQASIPLLVILIDAAGVEYLAETGIPMSGSGTHHCQVPLRRFRRAGWCSQVDKALDFSAITTIRIGWGGYYGPEGEAVRFSVSAPGKNRIPEL